MFQSSPRLDCNNLDLVELCSELFQTFQITYLKQVESNTGAEKNKGENLCTWLCYHRLNINVVQALLALTVCASSRGAFVPKGVPEHPDVHICHCGKECASYADFKAHLSSHIHNHLPSQGHSSNHGPGHGKERKWKCSMCPQAFISPSKLHVHFMGHMGMKPHKCDFCSKAFSDPSNLRTHLKIHTGEH